MCVCFLNFTATFIEDLLAVNMHSNGVLSLAKQKFSPQTAIRFVKDLFKPYFKDKKVDLICDNEIDPSESIAELM